MQRRPQVGSAAGAPPQSLEAALLPPRPKACTGAPGRARSWNLAPQGSPPQPPARHPRDWEAILVPGRPGPRPFTRPSRQAPGRAGRRDAGRRTLPWRPREPPPPPSSPGDYVTQAEDGGPGCCPYPWWRCVRDTGSRSGSAAPRRRAAATASDPARRRHSAPGGGRTPRSREAGPRRSHPI